MGERAAGNELWKRGEQYGQDGTASVRVDMFSLESWWRTALGWLQRKVCGEHGRILCFDRAC